MAVLVDQLCPASDAVDPTENPLVMLALARESAVFAEHLCETAANLRQKSGRLSADLQRLLAESRVTAMESNQSMC